MTILSIYRLFCFVHGKIKQCWYLPWVFFSYSKKSFALDSPSSQRIPICLCRAIELAMFVLHVDTFKARATFAPRSQAVKNKLWSLVVTGKYRSGTEFAVMNSSCYSCRESIKQLKLHKKYIYKSTATVQVLMTSPCFFPKFLLPMVFDKFKKSLRAGILKGIFDCRLRRLIYYFRLDFVLGTFPIRSRRQGTKNRKTRYVRVVCATSRCSNCGLPVPRRVITIFLDGGCC